MELDAELEFKANARIYKTNQKKRDWPMFMHDSAHSGVSADELTLPLELKWKYKTGVRSSPAVVNGIVYIGSDGVYALDANTGELKWKYKTGDWVRSSPAVANGIVYIGSDKYVYAFAKYEETIATIQCT